MRSDLDGPVVEESGPRIRAEELGCTEPGLIHAEGPPLSLGATNLLSLNTVFPFTQCSIIEMNTMCGLLGLACT